MKPVREINAHIDLALDHCTEHARGEGIALSEAITCIGSNSFCFAAFLLAVPFVQPVPLGPLTVICGASFISGDRGQRLVGWLILIGGALLAIPVANLPLNNFFPALMIIFACLGWLERDGLMILVSIAWGVVTIIYFALVTLALVFFGKQVLEWLNFFPI